MSSVLFIELYIADAKLTYTAIMMNQKTNQMH